MEIEIRSKENKHMVSIRGFIGESIYKYVSESSQYYKTIFNRGERARHGFVAISSDGFRNDLFTVIVEPGDKIIVIP